MMANESVELGSTFIFSGLLPSLNIFGGAVVAIVLHLLRGQEGRRQIVSNVRVAVYLRGRNMVCVQDCFRTLRPNQLIARNKGVQMNVGNDVWYIGKAFLTMQESL
jgi:hypothetical protein